AARHTVELFCSSTESERRLQYEFLIDTTPITNITFANMPNVSCGVPEEGFTLTGVWEGNDPESGNADMYSSTS
ncbi:MAG: hypothetical protein ACE5EY_14010, partial [Anaerolineae bacterium]